MTVLIVVNVTYRAEVQSDVVHGGDDGQGPTQALQHQHLRLVRHLRRVRHGREVVEGGDRRHVLLGLLVLGGDDKAAHGNQLQAVACNRYQLQDTVQIRHLHKRRKDSCTHRY